MREATTYAQKVALRLMGVEDHCLCVSSTAWVTIAKMFVPEQEHFGEVKLLYMCSARHGGFAQLRTDVNSVTISCPFEQRITQHSMMVDLHAEAQTILEVDACVSGSGSLDLYSTGIMSKDPVRNSTLFSFDSG